MQSDNKIRVMSFNLRSGVTNDGINNFVNRAPLVRELLETEKPDLIGFQEVVDMTHEFLCQTLSADYELLGCGRNADCRGERCMIAVRRARLEVISFGTRWLSQAPDVPGSRLPDCDQSYYPRVVCSALLKPIGGERFFRFINTHLDHVSAQARAKELDILEGWLTGEPIPAALTGDFNAIPESDEIHAFADFLAAHGWRDAANGVDGTYHDYGRCQPPTRIDYIFTNCGYENTHVPQKPERDGVFYSDHYAVVTDLNL